MPSRSTSALVMALQVLVLGGCDLPSHGAVHTPRTVRARPSVQLLGVVGLGLFGVEAQLSED